MEDNWRFQDEHMVRVLTGLNGISPQAIDKFRVEKQKFVSDALIRSNAVTGEQVIKAAEAVFKIKYAALSPELVERFALSLVPEKICRKYGLVPVKVLENGIQVAMSNPSDFNAQADVEAVTGRRVIPFFSLPFEMDVCLGQLFSSDEVIFDLLKRVEAPDAVVVVGEVKELLSANSDITSPIIQLVNSIISQAFRRHSSDIHIEHDERESHVRIRIDGELMTIMKLPRRISVGPVVSRIKIMSNLDVSNHMRPQDGRAKLRIGAAEVGLRVSTLPTSYGEKIVIRILDQRSAEVPFEKLGFSPEVTRGLDACLSASQGIVLVTGPTGSGKTTTLYSVLNKLKQDTTNIVTVEDPIEYKLPGINQVQVNEKQGLTFSAVLRSVLRQDPDIIMLGEIRDHETADIALQSAMTGHLVLSTLHTNDTISTISRLMDMGVDRFKISPGLLAITAQRLVRRLCPHCRETVPDAEADPDIQTALLEHGFPKNYYRGGGCKSCKGSGYSGRTSIVELLQANARLKELINSGAQGGELKAAATAAGILRTITHDALWHLSAGETDLAEIASYLDLKKPAQAPRRGPAAAPAVPPSPAAAPAAASGKLRVMIAEDDATMRMLLRKFIGAAGYEVAEAVDGEEALTAIAAGPAPDLLVSDINMPRLNGLDLVKGVRETLGLLDMPVIMLTTETSDKSQELAFKLGADDYIIKPFKAPLVMARINAALRRAGKIKL